jgi:hypothetical protein
LNRAACDDDAPLATKDFSFTMKKLHIDHIKGQSRFSAGSTLLRCVCGAKQKGVTTNHPGRPRRKKNKTKQKHRQVIIIEDSR